MARGGLAGWLHRAWHSPRTGPLLLVGFGLPALAVGLAVLAFPFYAVLELGRGLLVSGHVPFARAPGWLLAVMLPLWAVLIALLVQARRIATANRGLEVTIEVRQVGRPASAVVLAARLGAALRTGGVAVSEPIREDYGAGVWVEGGPDPLWVSVSGAGAREAWIGLSYDPGPDLRRRLTRRADRAGFAHVEAALRAVVSADPALSVAEP
jgi:hypothetical protein